MERSYLLAMGEELARALLAWGAGGALAWLAWQMASAAWRIYTHTLVGEHFIAARPDLASALNAFFSLEGAWAKALWASAEMLALAAAIAFFLRFIGLLGLFYLRWRYIAAPIWIVVLSVGLAPGFAERHTLPSTGTALFVLLSSACVTVPAAMASANAIGPSLWNWLAALWERWRALVDRWQ